MVTERDTYFFGASGSMLLHLVVVALALIFTRTGLEERQLQRPQIIQARLVEMESQTPEPSAPAERVIDLTRRQAPPPQPEPQMNTQPAEEPPADTAPAEPEPAPESMANSPESSEESAELPPVVQREQDFNAQLEAEAASLAEMANREQVMSYSAMIEQRVAANWSRPPSARRGMVAELRVSLVPTGRVVDVEVVQSSGDVAFDRSATQAVLKAQPFNQLQELSSAVFEDNFRTFRFRFSPDDLRL